MMCLDCFSGEGMEGTGCWLLFDECFGVENIGTA